MTVPLLMLQSCYDNYKHLAKDQKLFKKILMNQEKRLHNTNLSSAQEIQEFLREITEQTLEKINANLE